MNKLSVFALIAMLVLISIAARPGVGLGQTQPTQQNSLVTPNPVVTSTSVGSPLVTDNPPGQVDITPGPPPLIAPTLYVNYDAFCSRGIYNGWQVVGPLPALTYASLHIGYGEVVPDCTLPSQCDRRPDKVWDWSGQNSASWRWGDLPNPPSLIPSLYSYLFIHGYENGQEFHLNLVRYPCAKKIFLPIVIRR